MKTRIDSPSSYFFNTKKRCMKKTLIYIIIFWFVWYFWWIFGMKFLVNNWYTNSESKEITIENEKRYYLPDDIINTQCVQFILSWISNKKLFNTTVSETSYRVWLDYYIVMSAILGEQIRISCKWVRWILKNIIINWTPTLFRSYDVSVWVAWIKVGTALKIKQDAIKYWYGDIIKDYTITEEKITKDDKLSWLLATLLVKNIITRWQLSWYDISKDAWVIWTLYNMWNHPKKQPHANPKIWWAIIEINWQKFVYWEISLGLYNFFIR